MTLHYMTQCQNKFLFNIKCTFMLKMANKTLLYYDYIKCSGVVSDVVTSSVMRRELVYRSWDLASRSNSGHYRKEHLTQSSENTSGSIRYVVNVCVKYFD